MGLCSACRDNEMPPLYLVACVGSHDRVFRAFMHTKDRLHTLVRQSYMLHRKLMMDKTTLLGIGLMVL